MAESAASGGTITKSQQEEIDGLYVKMKEAAIEAMSESSAEQEKILRHLELRSSEISARQAADIVKNSYDAKEAAIADAINKTDVIIREAERLFDAGLITEEMYKKMVSDAETARDGAILAAEDTHKKVVGEAKKQAGEHAKYVD
jgi:hypothetical protein